MKKKHQFTVNVGKYKVPVRCVNASILRFSGGMAENGEHQHGDFAFWTAVLKRRKWSKGGGITGRARIGMDAGDRFNRIKHEIRISRLKEDREAYKRLWDLMEGGKNIAYIRPATDAAVKRWLAGHPKKKVKLIY